MNIPDFTKACAPATGGVASLRLIAAEDLKPVTFNAAGTECLMPQPAEGAAFAQVHMLENSASYEQSATGVGALAEVEHRIEFGITLRDDAVTLIERLGEASRRGGLAAVVELNTGLELLVGFSSRLVGEQPLLLTGCTVETYAERNKRPSIRVVLSCRDGQWSAICCGSLSNV